MNKLRKARPGESSMVTSAAKTNTMSRTMQLAVAGAKVTTANRRDTRLSGAAPHAKVEQYWAARALVAETLLSARERHQDELAEMRRIEERKRERDITAILQANEQRQKRLERMTGTMCLVVVLVGFVSSWKISVTPQPSKPSHFTIPILSPFTSVVEHETGVFGTKAIIIFVLVVGVAVYAALRYRLSQWRPRRVQGGTAM